VSPERRRTTTRPRRRARHPAPRPRRPARDDVTLTDGERLPFSFVFLFLGALPCAEWLDDVVARDDNGFVLTGAAVGSDALLATSVPGIYTAGDVRSGSTKRCATAVGEGAMAVQFVHARLAELAHAQQ
jgi:thioredoxin reductase (NADPH)